MKTLRYFTLLSCALLLFSCETESTTNDPSNNLPPGSFNLLFVNNNATDIILTPILTWSASTDPDGDEVTYELRIDRTVDLASPSDSPVTAVQSNIGTNTFTLTTPLAEGTEYKWQVVAYDGNGGETPSSSIFTFTTAQAGSTTNLPPNPFLLLTPANNATDVALSTTLTWQTATDPDNDPIFYDVFLLEGFGQTVFSGLGLLTPSQSINNLSANTTYNWYVLAKDIRGNVRSTSTFSFTTGDGTVSIGSLVSTNLRTGYDGYYGHQMVNFQGSVWEFGGRVSSSTVNGETNEVWKYNEDGSNFQLIKPHDPSDGSFVPSDEHQVVVFQDKMWVLEGNRNTARTTTDGINFSFVGFSGAVANDTHYGPRNQFQALEHNGRLFIIGGSSGGVLRNDVWSTDASLNNDGLVTWNKSNPTNANNTFSPRLGHQAVSFKGKIWVFGGSSGASRLNDVYSSIDGVDWVSEGTAPWTERTEHTAIVTRDGSGLIVIGGDGINPNSGNTVAELNDIWYTTDGVNWIEIKPHANDSNDDVLGRSQSEMAWGEGNKILLAAGDGNSGFLNDLWIIDPSQF